MLNSDWLEWRWSYSEQTVLESAKIETRVLKPVYSIAFAAFEIKRLLQDGVLFLQKNGDCRL